MNRQEAKTILEMYRPGGQDARDPRVAGFGLAALRDCVSFFRYAKGDREGNLNPMAGSVAHALMFGIPELDGDGRPKLFYGTLVHDNCPYRSYYDEKKFAKSFGEEGCRVELGCKGPESYSDCWKRGWNNNVNWCVHNSLCLGCTQPGYPDAFSPMYVKTTG